MLGAVDALADPGWGIWMGGYISALFVTCVLAGVYATRAFRSKLSTRVRALIVGVNLTPFVVMVSRGLLGLFS